MEQRERLIELLSEYHSGNHDEAQRIVDHLLADDVVVLPCRCKECSHAKKLKNSFHGLEYSCNYFNSYSVHGDDFCSHAKRKGG